jgi:hypothetical protein
MDSSNPRPFLKSGTPGVDGCSSAIVYVLSRFLFLFFCFFFFFSLLFISADSRYQPPSLYSLMCIIGYSMSIIQNVGKILLEMLTIDSYWELDTV